MKRLYYPLVLVFLSLLTAAFITTVTAKTLASYLKVEKENGLVKESKMLVESTASR